MATNENKPVAAPDKSAAEYQKTGQAAADKATGDSKASDSKATPTKAAPAKAAPTSADVRASRRGDAADNPFGGVADELRESHESRVTGDGDGVDARLDNRRGKDRPKLEEWPAKPQQVDGPDIVHQVEFTRKALQERENEDLGDRKGMFSPGPHGLGDEDERESEADR